MAIRIEPVASDEAFEALLPLIEDYQRFYESDTISEAKNRTYFARFVPPNDYGTILGAWDGDDMVGFACIYWTGSSIEARDVALMSDLLVRADQRGKGVGRALIDACAAAARERGCAWVEWLTHVNNRTAQRLYEQTGANRDTWFGYDIPTE
jgi:GNAT superfamily N-acetyltransferase